MKNICIFIALMGILVIAVPGATATVLTFDDISDITSEPFYDDMPDVYGGLHWGGCYYGDGDKYDAYIYNISGGSLTTYYGAGVVSGDYMVFNDELSGLGVYTASGVNWDFLGANLSSPYGDLTLTVLGYDDGNFKYGVNVGVMQGIPLYYPLNITGIDALVIDAGGERFVMDNFTFNFTSVPEPSTLLLIGTGLMGLVGFRRKFRV